MLRDRSAFCLETIMERKTIRVEPLTGYAEARKPFRDDQCGLCAVFSSRSAGTQFHLRLAVARPI